MATWKSGADVLADLDRLSNLTVGTSQYLGKCPIPRSYSKKEPEPDPPYELQSFDNFKDDFNGSDSDSSQDLSGSFSKEYSGRGRGMPWKRKSTSVDSVHQRDRELQAQLRQVCGMGYSNDLIEAHFSKGGEVDNSIKTKVRQISPPAKLTAVNNSKIPVDKGQFEDVETDSPGRKENASSSQKPVQMEPKYPKQPKRCRNAAILSLTKLNSSKSMPEAPDLPQLEISNSEPSSSSNSKEMSDLKNCAEEVGVEKSAKRSQRRVNSSKSRSVHLTELLHDDDDFVGGSRHKNFSKYRNRMGPTSQISVPVVNKAQTNFNFDLKSENFPPLGI